MFLSALYEVNMVAEMEDLSTRAVSNHIAMQVSNLRWARRVTEEEILFRLQIGSPG